MSLMQYFEKPGTANDSMFKFYSEFKTAQTAIPELRRKLLSEACGVVLSKSGKPELTVIDQKLFDGLQEAIQAKEMRIAIIERVFAAIDTIVDEIKQHGIMIRVPSLYGISNLRQNYENQKYSNAQYMKNSAIEALQRGVALKDIPAQEVDGGLLQRIEFLKNVEARALAAVGEL